MARAISADWIKVKRNRKIMLLCAAPIFIVLLLYLFQTYWADGAFRLTVLRAWRLAGAYALVIFATIVRKIWGIIFGFELIRMELIENRSDFFVQRTGRCKMWGSKVLLSMCISLIVILLVCSVPVMILLFAGSDVSASLSVSMLLLQCLFVWLMTLGSILTGMLLALIIKDVMVILCIVLTLEFFSGIYPKMILNIWDRIDGYIYVSPLMLPLKIHLESLDNFSFFVSELYSPHFGIVLWIIMLVFYTCLGFIIFSKKVF